MGHVNQMLGECNDLPFLFRNDPELRDVSNDPAPRTTQFDWPNDLLNRIKEVMASLCNTPSAPEFIFELSDESTKHNLAMFEKYNFSLEEILNAQQDSPLGPGKEFRPPNILRSVFGLHPFGIERKAPSRTAANGR